MANLLVKPDYSHKDGKIIDVTPEVANWQFVGFQVYVLEEGKQLQQPTRENEVCLVVLSGKVSVATEQATFTNIGKRMSVFEKIPPYAVYVPNDDIINVTALTKAKIALCKAPGKGTYPARLIKPEDVRVSQRGSGKMSRTIHDILPETEPADHLLVVEVFTPDGNTSSYPPHKHDQDNLPYESYLEETYYHEIHPQQGYAFQRVYNDARTLDETMTVEHEHVVLVPEGYHPVTCLPGYESYYLNVMAGPKRTWKFHNEKAHEWLFEGM